MRCHLWGNFVLYCYYLTLNCTSLIAIERALLQQYVVITIYVQYILHPAYCDCSYCHAKNKSSKDACSELQHHEIHKWVCVSAL